MNMQHMKSQHGLFANFNGKHFVSRVGLIGGVRHFVGGALNFFLQLRRIGQLKYFKNKKFFFETKLLLQIFFSKKISCSDLFKYNKSFT